MRLTLKERWTPISQAEYLHQRRSMEARRSRWWVALPRKVLMTLSVFAAAFIFILTGGTSLGILVLNYMPPDMALLAFVVWVLIPGFALLPMTLLTHFGLMMRTLLHTSNSIPREKVGGTWDLLLLTGTSAREIVLSKWRATIKQVLPSYMRLALLRMAVILWVFEWERVRLSFYPTLDFSFNEYYTPPHPLLPILSLGLITMFTLVNALITAAIGMLTAFMTKRAGINTFIAFVLRTVLFGMPMILVYLSFIFMLNFAYTTNYYDSFAYDAYSVAQVASITLADNGMLISGATAAIRLEYFRTPRDLIMGCAAVGGAFLYYLFAMLLMLWGARVLAYRQSALKQRGGKKQKVPSTMS